MTGPSEPFSHRAEAELCERVLGDRRHGIEPVPPAEPADDPVAGPGRWRAPAYHGTTWSW